MPQTDMNIANDSGANVRSDMNDHIAALVQLSSGATAPGTTFAHMLWADTTPAGYTIIKIRDAADGAFATLFDDEGRWKGVNGTAAEPSISFGNRTNAGFYTESAANPIAWSAAGVKAGHIDQNGTMRIVGGLAVFDNITSQKSIAGETNFLTAVHTDTTNTASHTQITAQTAGSGGGDPFFQWTVQTQQSYVMGIDNSDLDKLVISAGQVIGTTNIMELDASRRVSIGGSPLTNMAAGDLALEGGSLVLKEITTPTADAAYGKIYFKADNKAYVQTGDGVEHELAFA